MRQCWVLSSDPASVAIVRERLSILARRRTSPTPTDWWRMSTVVVEAVTNAIVHGHACAPGYWIGVAVEIGPQRAVLRVLDAGPSFRFVRRSPRASATHGRGLQIMAGWCETLTVRRKAGVNIVEMHYCYGA